MTTAELMGAYKFGTDAIREMLKEQQEVPARIIERLLEITDKLVEEVEKQ